MAAGGPVIALYIVDDETPGPWRWGGASRWWLHHSLAALIEAGIEARSFNAGLLFEPWTVKTRQDGPFKVFTSFWKALLAGPAPAAPDAILPGPRVGSEVLSDWALLPHAPDWAAGMRELWASGWMHNRVRMVASSSLTEHLLLSWQRGAAWFWDTLVDADLARNSAGWRWVAGCGADAAPYFRIFKPVRQGERLDPDGAYMRRWAPELARLSDGVIHCPWEASPSLLRDVGVDLGRTYPSPMIDHAAARARALTAYKSFSETD